MARINDIGIDLGTSNILIGMKGKGVILHEPTVVALERDTHTAIAFGEEAARMLGRTPSHILATRPLRDGTISDYSLVHYMLQSFMAKAYTKSLFYHPRAIIALPSGISDNEIQNISATLYDAGMRKTQFINRSIAAAIGSKLPMDEAYGTIIVDISAGVCDIAVLSLGQVVVSECANVGSDRFDEAIVRHLRRKHMLLIGERTAEQLKINIGSAIQRDEQLYMDVTGRNLISGLPKTIRITSDDITQALSEPLEHLVEVIHGILEHTPAELAADIFEYGILLSGGGAELFGLSNAITELLNVPCTVADDPQYNIIHGCLRTLDNNQDLGRFLDHKRRRFLAR